MLSTSSSSQQHNNKKWIFGIIGGSVAAVSLYFIARRFLGGSSGQQHQGAGNTNNKKHTATTTSTTDGSSSAPGKIKTQMPQTLSAKDAEKKAAAIRLEGNTFFTQGRLDHALECYQRVIDLVEPIDSGDAKKLGCLAMANAAMCFLKQHRHQAAENSTTVFLDTAWVDSAEPQLVVKVLYRRAQARNALDRKEEAIEDLKQASQLSGGGNNEVEQLLQKLTT